MYPRLYDAKKLKSTYFGNNGHGFFNAVESCKVTEARNGEYSLEMIILPCDRLAQTVGIGMIIKAMANPHDEPQLFYITSISVDTNGKITILANHIKYLAMQNYTSGYVGGLSMTGTPKEIIDELLSDMLIDEYNFNFDSDITTRATVSLGFTTIEKIGDVYGGKEGSLLYVFGGEYYFDNFNIRLLNKRGSDTTKVVRFGKNISSYKQTISNDNVYTHIVGVAYVQNRANSDRVASKVAFHTDPVQVLVRPFSNVAIVDFTSQIDDVVDSSTGYHYADVNEKLNGLTRAYVKARGKTMENINISITYEGELDKLQDIGLCDTVQVYYPPMGVSYTSKIVKVVFDSISEKYTQIDINDVNISLSNFTKNRRS